MKNSEKIVINQMLARVIDYAAKNGSIEVHRSWRDTMIQQKRGVPDRRMVWENLDSKDKVLDAQIAYDVVKDFLVRFEAHRLNNLI